MPEPGERMLIPCEGGPGISRRVTWPPPLEIDLDDGGVYVLDERDDGWIYVYVEARDRL